MQVTGGAGHDEVESSSSRPVTVPPQCRYQGTKGTDDAGFDLGLADQPGQLEPVGKLWRLLGPRVQ